MAGNESPSSSSSSDSKGAIIGAIIGVLTLLLIIGAIVFLVVRKRRGKRSPQTSPQASPQMEDPRSHSDVSLLSDLRESRNLLLKKVEVQSKLGSGEAWENFSDVSGNFGEVYLGNWQGVFSYYFHPYIIDSSCPKEIKRRTRARRFQKRTEHSRVWS